MLDYKIRSCTAKDVRALLELVKELAESQNSLHKVTATEEGLTRCFFGERPSAEAIIAEIPGEIIGFAVFFNTNSTYMAKPCLYLEDLYVKEKYRGHGAGKGLLLKVVSLAHERGCARVDWLVYDWNKSASDFYRSLGAIVRDEIRPYRLESAAIEALVRTSVSS
jgi:GNAT superfamily N-acetyltransferase